MTIRILFALALALAGSAAFAADAAEIAFWESVRNSNDPVELRAYIERFPSGTFVVLARQRLARLESGARPTAPGPAAQPQAAPPTVIAWTTPQAGDRWTYRWIEKKPRGTPIERTLVVTVASAGNGEVVDLATIDGGTPPLQSKHVPGSHLIAQGAAVFSPYLPVLTNIPATGSIWRVQIQDPACSGRYICDAKGRIVGRETVHVGAGTFNANKIVIEHSWRSAGATAFGGSGGRTLTVWYAPEAKRAVKYISRTSFGQYPPIEADFEVELVSYQVN